MGVGLAGERQSVGQGEGAFLRIPFFRDPDQNAANVLEHGGSFENLVRFRDRLISVSVLHQGTSTAAPWSRPDRRSSKASLAASSG